jgi:hypothetical protein
MIVQSANWSLFSTFVSLAGEEEEGLSCAFSGWMSANCAKYVRANQFPELSRHMFD